MDNRSGAAGKVRQAQLFCLSLLVLTACSRSPPRKIDVHTHFGPDGAAHMAALMKEHGIDAVVNLSGGWPGRGLEQSLAVARAMAPARVIVFCTPPFQAVVREQDWSAVLAPQLEEAHRLGCRGVKIFKSLGLSVVGPDGALVAVDDPRLDGLFEAAGRLDMPVSIHSGDPVAFWQPPTAANERIAELSVHPGWSYWGRPVPSWEALFEAYQRRVARHPRTTFIGVHFGNAPEDPARVRAMLRRLPNLYVDTAARVPELGRRAAEVRELVLEFPDRILWGTDLGVGPTVADLMLGSTGATPPTAADVRRFFGSTWRFFETADRGFESPTPIQGQWTIDGIGLPRDVLHRVYRGNAARLLHLE